MEKGYRKVPRELHRNRIRKGFDLNGGVSCKSCFERDRVIEDLREELVRAKQKIIALEKKGGKVRVKDVEGAHTSSAQKRFKESTSSNQPVRGWFDF
jgi:preprotein translocase subunit SecD